MSLTATASGSVDEVTREELLKAIKSFKFGPMPGALESPP
jgi:hypothetical protein